MNPKKTLQEKLKRKLAQKEEELDQAAQMTAMLQQQASLKPTSKSHAPGRKRPIAGPRLRAPGAQ